MRPVYPRAAALLIAVVAVAPAQAAQSQRYEPEAASGHLTVQGTSTMHDWEAAGNVIRGHLILSETDLASLWAKGASSSRKIAPTVHVEIPVESLKSGKAGLDKKMHETLKARTYPMITYRLETADLQSEPELNANKTDTEEQLAISTDGILTIAGNQRAVEIPMRIRRLSNSRMEVSGEATLRMTDFGMSPPKLMLGALRTGNEVHVRWTWLLAPARDNNASEQNREAGIRVAGAVPAHSEAPLPVKAKQLMPLEHSDDVYVVKEGADEGKKVPVTLRRRDDRWLLTQEGLMWHELQRDTQGNVLILRETDLRDDREVEYDPPIVLLPAQVDSDTSLTGKTRVTIKNARTDSVTYRGECEWKLDFIGIQPLETPAGTFLTYRLKATRRIHLGLVSTLVTVDFDYVLGQGMMATGIDQVSRFLGLFSSRTTWRLERFSAQDRSA